MKKLINIKIEVDTDHPTHSDCGKINDFLEVEIDEVLTETERDPDIIELYPEMKYGVEHKSFSPREVIWPESPEITTGADCPEHSINPVVCHIKWANVKLYIIAKRIKALEIDQRLRGELLRELKSLTGIHNDIIQCEYERENRTTKRHQGKL